MGAKNQRYQTKNAQIVQMSERKMIEEVEGNRDLAEEQKIVARDLKGQFDDYKKDASWRDHKHKTVRQNLHQSRVENINKLK